MAKNKSHQQRAKKQRTHRRRSRAATIAKIAQEAMEVLGFDNIEQLRLAKEYADTQEDKNG